MQLVVIDRVEDLNEDAVPGAHLHEALVAATADGGWDALVHFAWAGVVVGLLPRLIGKDALQKGALHAGKAGRDHLGALAREGDVASAQALDPRLREGTNESLERALLVGEHGHERVDQGADDDAACNQGTR